MALLAIKTELVKRESEGRRINFYWSEKFSKDRDTKATKKGAVVTDIKKDNILCVDICVNNPKGDEYDTMWCDVYHDYIVCDDVRIEPPKDEMKSLWDDYIIPTLVKDYEKRTEFVASVILV